MNGLSYIVSMNAEKAASTKRASAMLARIKALQEIVNSLREDYYAYLSGVKK